MEYVQNPLNQIREPLTDRGVRGSSYKTKKCKKYVKKN